MDNDLLSLWCNALVLDESQVRDVIQMLQDARNTNEAEAADEVKNLEAELDAVETERDQIAQEREDLAQEAADLAGALQTATDVIIDYLDYRHDGDPTVEDARLMGEMEINDYGDRNLAAARALLTARRLRR